MVRPVYRTQASCDRLIAISFHVQKAYQRCRRVIAAGVTIARGGIVATCLAAHGHPARTGSLSVQSSAHQRADTVRARLAAAFMPRSWITPHRARFNVLP